MQHLVRPFLSPEVGYARDLSYADQRNLANGGSLRMGHSRKHVSIQIQDFFDFDVSGNDLATVRGFCKPSPHHPELRNIWFSADVDDYSTSYLICTSNYSKFHGLASAASLLLPLLAEHSQTTQHVCTVQQAATLIHPSSARPIVSALISTRPRYSKLRSCLGRNFLLNSPTGGKLPNK